MQKETYGTLIALRWAIGWSHICKRWQTFEKMMIEIKLADNSIHKKDSKNKDKD